MQTDTPSAIPGKQPVGANRAVTLMNECRELFSSHLKEWLGTMMNGIDDVFFEMANKAGSNAEQNQYFDAMREIRLQRETIEKVFAEEIIKPFALLGKPIAPEKKKEGFDLSGGLQLVDESDLEESLATQTMISKAIAQYHETLSLLEQRLSTLVKGGKIDSSNNPMSPQVIGEAFRTSVKTLELHSHAKIIFFKQFEKTVMAEVGQIYDEAHERLIEAGILPDLKYIPAGSANKAKSSAAPKKPDKEKDRDTNSEKSAIKSTEEGILIQPEFFNTLQSLLGSRRAQEGTGLTFPPGTPVAEMKDVISALTNLQNQAQSLSVGAVKDQLIVGIRSDSGEQRAFNQVDEDTVDVISMLFDYILDDRSLHDSMKALISRLQIPLLKVAIMDKEFFAKKLHPARKLLNELAQAALGWTEDQDRGENSLYWKVDNIVHRVLTEFESDPQLFTTLLEDFDEFITRERKRVQALEKRANEAAKGADKLESSKAKVAEALETRLKDKRLPKMITQILTEPWKDVLLLIHLREGEESADWKSHLELVEQIIWSVQPKAAGAERQILLKSIPKIVSGLRAGLQRISYDQIKTEKAIKDLEACHIACLRGQNILPEAPPPAPVSAPAESAPIEKPTPETPPPPADEFMERAQKLELGSWLEFIDENERKFRAKLAWKTLNGKMIFINRKGVKVAERTLPALAAELRSQKTIILDSVPLMDKALDAVMTSLKKYTSGAAKPAT